MKNKALSLIENLCEIKLSHVYYQCGGQSDSHAQEAQTSWRAKRENEKNCLSFVPPPALPSFRFVILQKTLFYTLYNLIQFQPFTTLYDEDSLHVSAVLRAECCSVDVTVSGLPSQDHQVTMER